MTESKVASHPRALICLPTYNEAENLPLMVRAVHEVVPNVDILVIDDGSPDGTGRIADEIAAGDGRVHVLHRKAKEGLGRAYIAGFRWALERDYELIFEMDCDFSHQPRYLVDFLARAQDADVVLGSRYIPGGGTKAGRGIGGCSRAAATPTRSWCSACPTAT